MWSLLRLEGGDGRILEPGAEPLGLGFHVHDEHRAVDAIDEAREIFDEGGGGKLAAGLAALEDQGLEAGAGGVDGGGKACAAGADDDHFFHRWDREHSRRYGRFAINVSSRAGEGR